MQNSAELYDPEFFRSHADLSSSSARAIVPLVIDLVRPKAVVDVGCGIGAWLSVFQTKGCEVTGVDGSYVDASELLIPGQRFIAKDLSLPLSLDRTFDLVCSLEVAEHLDSSRAESFVRDLCALGPVVLFSAAIPGQGGVHHVNEQWQDYWAELFKRHDYAVFDAIRGAVWFDSTVAVHYRQNALLYVRRSEIERFEALRKLSSPERHQLRVVHPEVFTGLHAWHAPENVSVRQAARQFSSSLGRAVKRRLGRAPEAHREA